MKTWNFKFAVLTAFFVSAIAFSAKAQIPEDPKYGPTPEARKANIEKLNFFNDAYQGGDYNRAVGYLQDLIRDTPKASQNVYIRGINIYKNKIARATTLEEKNTMIDSVLMLYDLRIEHFGDANPGRSQLTEMKAKEYVNYKPDDIEGGLKLLNDAIELEKENADPDLVNLYFKFLADGYQADKIETSQLLDAYDRFSHFYEICTSPKKDEGKQEFDQIFVSSGAANCDNLEKVYRPQIVADPNNAELVEKVFMLLTRAGCKNDFQIELGEAYYAKNPSTSIALYLAEGLEAKGDYQKARKYLNEAIATESDPIAKANLAVRIGAGELAQNNYRSANDFARQAIDANPENGFAYMILGQAVGFGANNQCGNDSFVLGTTRWLAVDYLTKASSLLSSSDPERAKTASTAAAQFRANFPDQQDIFFHGLTNGQAYTVSCGWISGRTTVRGR